jgi:hypothetical protein
VATADGGRAEIGPGEAYEIEPGHDGWVVGDEPVISIEFLGRSDLAGTFGRPSGRRSSVRVRADRGLVRA